MTDQFGEQRHPYDRGRWRSAPERGTPAVGGELHPRVLAGRYRIDRRIAIGAMGEVWRGVDLVLRRAVAVKVLRAKLAADPDAAVRFGAEARCLAGLSHPGITKVYDYWDVAPPFLVMELVDGPSLALVLASGPLAPWRALDVVAQAARALHASHRAGVIHRDVKPANLVMTRGGQVKLTDFGIAHTTRSSTLTTLDIALGTPAYLAPERVAGAPAGPASDVYSLGVVMYECLTGARPFSGTTSEVAAAHHSRPFPSLPEPAPPAISELLADMTAKVPEGRPTSASAVASRAAALRDALLLPGAARYARALCRPQSAPSQPTRHDPPHRVRRQPAGSAPRSRATSRIAHALAAMCLTGVLTAVFSGPGVPKPGAVSRPAGSR